jgi:hypothetical protein
MGHPVAEVQVYGKGAGTAICVLAKPAQRLYFRPGSPYLSLEALYLP